jgi:ABC-2 type transport system ATP-binding protein
VTGTPPAIEVLSLTRRFGAQVAVDHVTLAVHRGEILALLGPNGAGKTTVVRMLAALMRPTEGTCRVGGFDVRADPDRVREVVGLMTDLPGVYPDMKLRPYLQWFGSLYRLSARGVKVRTDELIEAFGLTPWAAAPLGTLSRGTQQKVALARCLLHDPAVLLLDEPTASLDVETTISLRELFRALKRRERTIILCTHNLAEAEKVADSVAILIAGRIVHTQPVRSNGGGVVEVVTTSTGQIPPGLIESCSGVIAGTVRLNGSALSYRTATPDVTNPEVVARLVRHGRGIITVREPAESLEEIYLRHAGSARG